MRICAKRSIEYYNLELNFQRLRFCWPLKWQMALALPNGIIMPGQGRRNFKQKTWNFAALTISGKSTRAGSIFLKA